MPVNAKTLCSYLLLACVADAVALQTTEADESSVAEVVGSGSMRIMRSEALAQPHSHHKEEAPETDDEEDDDESSGKLKIEVYYESRCPDCVEFINNTIAPFWRSPSELWKQVELYVNPYGNAMSVPMTQISKGYKFWHPERQQWEQIEICQHGNEECFANTIHACAIKKLPQKQHMELILCMMSLPYYGIEKSSFECMDKLKIDKKKIKECTQSAEGEKILAEFGKETAKVPGRKGTPWLMINGKNYEPSTKTLFTKACHHAKLETGTCKPFATTTESKHKKDDQDVQDAGSYFPVLTKMDNVDKERVGLPAPKKV